MSAKCIKSVIRCNAEEPQKCYETQCKRMALGTTGMCRYHSTYPIAIPVPDGPNIHPSLREQPYNSEEFGAFESFVDKRLRLIMSLNQLRQESYRSTVVAYNKELDMIGVAILALEIEKDDVEQELRSLQKNRTTPKEKIDELREEIKQLNDDLNKFNDRWEQKTEELAECHKKSRHVQDSLSPFFAAGFQASEVL